MDRLLLSPEGFRLEEMKRLTLTLLRTGVRTFSFSLHSPSLKVGCTPYVQSTSDLERFLDRCRRYFEFFLRELNGLAMTPSQLREEILSHSKAAA